MSNEIPDTIEPYLHLLAEKGGSDLFFSTGTKPAVKIDGTIRPIGQATLVPGKVRKLAYGLLEADQIEHFEKHLEYNLAISRSGLGRFRVNIFLQRGEVAMVIRFIKPEVPNAADLSLPSTLNDFMEERRGLILVVGATGTGKSTTLASMIDHRNHFAPGHILTIEDPMEYAFSHGKCIVNQREVGVDTHSYENALKEALREAPDVIMIGEVRDRGTMGHAIAYADTGHLALSTLHANNAHQALDRIVRFFPDDARDQLFMDLSLNLKAIISQRLIPTQDGGRVPAVEILVNTPYVADLIHAGRISDIPQAMERGEQSGMQTFDQSLYQLFQDGKISREEALQNASSRNNLEWMINYGDKDEGKEAAAGADSDMPELPE